MKYALPREDVEAQIKELIKIPEQFDTPSRQRFQEQSNSRRPERRPYMMPKASPNNLEDRKLDLNTLKDIKDLFNSTTASEIKIDPEDQSFVPKQRKPRNRNRYNKK